MGRCFLREKVDGISEKFQYGIHEKYINELKMPLTMKNLLKCFLLALD